MERDLAWLEARQYTIEQLEIAKSILEEVRAGHEVMDAIRRHPLPSGGYVGKHVLVHVYSELIEGGEWSDDPSILPQIRMKPGRTLSGVTTVSALTKPYPCPGECIFCPDDVRVPKSYLPDEPGAMRGVHHDFDPYAQTCSRLEALQAIGHPTDKIELIILGGTWSAYPAEYQVWFVQRCLDALNGFDSADLPEAQSANQDVQHKNVGLVIETRPDQIDLDEIRRLRELGVTKVQMGAQSMDDHILELNHRGHTVVDTRRAVSLLRSAGFKVVLHWMPNLLGATLDSDRADFLRLWEDPELHPDEIKIYPCQLLEETKLYELWKNGEYTPYSTEELIDLVADLKLHIPQYCRVNRVVRDIPSHHVVAGNKRTSLRQDIHRELERREQRCACIRCREIRERPIDPRELKLDDMAYQANGGQEYFLSFVTSEDDLAGYLRLYLPGPNSVDTGMLDLINTAIIREVHIYGQSLEVGLGEDGAAQHVGLGEQLISQAEKIAENSGFERIAVIAALGTRGYYHRLGYELGETYMLKELV
ncbi:MAG TPA: tRNA uridine(34) 5-carboxymethylaminomethyl modification radical SAM/GNAT enzyme Elp3 [Anaerolineae bacterium]|nr:tRNA uridine(34) 5-carboxymethylaminomethyl modification radical SAM/GNAT enzyme Elp3 [Anaerolineae bacterium]